MYIRTSLLVLFLGLASPMVSANPAYPAYYPPAQYQLPGGLLREGLEKVMRYLAQGAQQNPQQALGFVEQELAPYFDFEYMNYWVMGNLQRQMSPQQVNEMQQELKAMFLQAMARQLASYRFGHIQYLRPRGNPNSGEVSLGLRVYSYQGQATRLDFRLYLGKQGWKVFDIVADGQSVVAHYRAMFARRAMGGAQQAAYPYYR